MIIHDHHDALLTQTVTAPAAASSAAASGVIDILEPGGSEAADLIITCDAASQALTLEVQAAADETAEEFGSVLTYTTEPNTAFSVRERIPKTCPRFIRLSVKTGDTAPDSAPAATLRVGA